MQTATRFMAVGAIAVGFVAARGLAAPPPAGAQLVQVRPGAATASTQAVTPEWGVSANSAVTMPARAFSPIASTVTFDESSDGMRYTTGGAGSFGTGVNLPSGAAITGIELVYCNEDPAGFMDFGLRDCPDTGACTSTGYWTGNGSPGNCGTGLGTLGSALTVTNGTHSYDFWVATSQASNLTRFRAGRVIYHLQISPAPGTATFNDVPTNYWAFQHIEALAASGITSGCGNGNFCPTAPVTRDQMAVFLAKALGLHWAP